LVRSIRGPTHNMANLRGLVARTGKRKKQMTKHAAAARLHPPKTSRRSHLLTRGRGQLMSENGSIEEMPLLLLLLLLLRSLSASTGR
jgi:hypothetical protein